MSSYPRNGKEWWQSLTDHHADIATIVDKYNPDELIAFRQLYSKHDNAVANILANTWGLAPDSPSIHDNPGWSELCDLCSESYVLEEATP